MWPQPCQGSCLDRGLNASSSGHIIFSRKKVGKKIEISSRNGKTFEDPTLDLSDEYFIFQRIFFWMWGHEMDVTTSIFDSTKNSSPLQILGFRQYFRNSVFLIGFSAKSAYILHVHNLHVYIQWNQVKRQHTWTGLLTSKFHRFLFWDHLWRVFDASCVLGVL